MAAGKQDHEGQDSDRYQGQGSVIEKPARPVRLAFTPSVELRAVFYANFVQMAEVIGKLACLRIPVLRIPFQRPIDDLLKLRRNGWIENRGWSGIIQQTIIHRLHGV